MMVVGDGSCIHQKFETKQENTVFFLVNWVSGSVAGKSLSVEKHNSDLFFSF